jgi:hypothetical protein
MGRVRVRSRGFRPDGVRGGLINSVSGTRINSVSGRFYIFTRGFFAGTRNP